jgi:L-lactate dehydrogenase complex protein LldG
MRDYVAGVDIGFTVADRAIAETGTMVFNSDSEDLRLATMVSEIHAALVPVSRIAPTAVAIAPELRKAFSGAPNYTAFVTGASRTADIERVLTLGVHGPLELHIYLWEDK